MRLCWLIPTDKSGGVASVALSCCRQASIAGHKVTLLLVEAPTGWIETPDEFCIDSLYLFGSFEKTPRLLINWLRDNPQDLLLLNGCVPADIAIPHLPVNLYAVHVVHDTAPDLWKYAVLHEGDLDAIVAVSHTVARKFSEKLRDPGKLHVLHNGTMLGPLPDLEADRPHDLLFLGGDKPMKGASDIPLLWSKLIERGFGGTLHWYGEVDTTLRERVERLPASHRVVFYGRVPRSQIFERASRCRVLLMLSRVEPFGMATVEGMGMGCVPVAWDIDTGTKEIVENECTGLYALLGDYESLATQVMRACADHRFLASEAVRVARTRFSEEAMWSRYALLLETLKQQSPVQRTHAGAEPPDYRPPVRYFQMLPAGMKRRIRGFLARSPKLSYWLRDLRGI